MTNSPWRHVGKVVGIEVYRNDVVVLREGGGVNHDPAPRKEITMFSPQSRRRLAFVALNSIIEFRTFVTLTYPREFPCDGREVKAHLNAFLMDIRRKWGGPSYLWFLEFQKRGAPHIHILFDYPLPRRAEPRRGVRLYVSTTWYRIVDSGDHRHLAAGTNVQARKKKDGLRFYAVKYASKMRQKQVPEEFRNVGRFWGCSRDVVPTAEQTIRATEDDIRGTIEEWEHRPSDDRPLYHVLYNQAHRFRSDAPD